MKILVAVVCLLTGFSVFGESFKLPRSEVVTVVDQSTSRVYPLYIQMPRSYKSQKNKKYPVIYVTDAPYAFPIAAGATRFPMNSGTMEEAIIVGISYAKGDKGPSSRIRDYTMSQASSWKLKTGDADNHAKFIRQDVFSYIEKNYRVDSNKRTYVGNSLGGLFGAYIVMKHPEMFSDYILGSPSVWFNNYDLLQITPNKPNKAIRVYLSVGRLETPEFGEREDMVTGANKLADKMLRQTHGLIDLKLHIVEGARHSTVFPTTFIQGLDWIHGSKK